MSETETKKSTIFYYEWNKLIKMLPDDKKLILYETILSENPTRPEDETTACIFDFINDKLDENFNKYQDIRQKRKEAAEKRWGKAKAKKEPTKKPVGKAIDIYKLMVDRKHQLISKITTKEFEFFSSLNDADKSEMIKLFKEITPDFDDTDVTRVRSGYKLVRNLLLKDIETTTTVEQSINDKEPTSTLRNSLQDLKADKGEIEFYDNYWNNCKDKTVTVMGIEYDINLSEQMFFLSGTKKTGKFTEGRILEEIWKLQKQGK